MGNREFGRAQRLGDQIHREVAMLIETRLSDPRVQEMTVTAVKVSRDLGHARVYYTTLSDDREALAEGLTKATPYLRRLLADQLVARITPRLSFVFDESIGRGRDMEALIREVVGPAPPEPDATAEQDPEEGPTNSD